MKIRSLGLIGLASAIGIGIGAYSLNKQEGIENRIYPIGDKFILEVSDPNGIDEIKLNDSRMGFCYFDIHGKSGKYFKTEIPKSFYGELELLVKNKKGSLHNSRFSLDRKNRQVRKLDE